MKSIYRRGQRIAGALTLLVALAARASAQTPVAPGTANSSAASPSEAADAEARAQLLFLEAWRLMDQQRPAEACVMFRRALEIKRTPSILNNVGRCFQQENDLIGAIETFESSVALAEQQPPGPKRDSWLAGARSEIDALRPRVAQLVLELPNTPQLKLALDGKLLASAWPLYLLPGRHVLVASAPERVLRRVELDLPAGERTVYRLPELQRLPPPPVDSSPAPAVASTAPRAEVAQRPIERELPSTSQGRARILPWALVGTGSAVIAAGIATGLIASSKEQELEDNCPQGNCPNPSTEPGWQEKIHDTKRIALVTDVLWGVGLATLGAGITLLVIDPAGDEPAQTELQAGCRGGGCGLALSGRF